ncbi:MAG: hypothetical protein PHY26_01610 [Bacilli bacterium]|jgi:hypothetical protein|nr:hypothetical protein [Bacilli bacterium]
MKKTFFYIALAIIIGFIYGKLLFDQYDKELEAAFKKTSVIYILQQGVYSSLDNVEKNTTKLDYYIVDKDNEYYRVYVGITQNKNNVPKIKEIYTKLGNDIYVRELTNNNQAFLEILTQYDLLLEPVTDEEQISQIEKQVLAKYEELVIENE